MQVKMRHVMMFAKSTDPDSQKAKQILEEYYLSKGKEKKNSRFEFDRFLFY
jgi:hypothetical protein